MEELQATTLNFERKKVKKNICEKQKRSLRLHPARQPRAFSDKQEDTFIDILNWQPSRSNTRQKNKSNRIERFEKTTRPSVK